MSNVSIKKISDEEIKVNGHTLYLDATGNWNGAQYLSHIEQKAAACYVAALEKNKK
jgi:hypothetical protein